MDPAEVLCGLCRRVTPPFQRAAAYGSYEGALRGLIHLLKYEQVRPAAEVLGGMLSQAIARLSPRFESNPVLLLPVPLHREKLRQRGFNQTELIARAALRLAPKGSPLVLETGVLKRQRATTSQIGLTRHQRRANVRGAFVVARPDRIIGREILLVDDVFTTGTTVSECARVLRRAGASKVWVATAARTLKAGVQEEGLRVVGLAAAA
jgi:ComF family protein